MQNDESIKYVIVKIGHQKFGILVERIVDILLPQKIFPIPLAPLEITGSINLRGKIVTALDIRKLLDINESEGNSAKKCIIIEYKGELFSFVVDEVGEVNYFLAGPLIKNPDNLSELWQEVSLGICPILAESSAKEELTVILNINKLLEYVVSLSNNT